MDLDAEMRKLQEEARRTIAAREQADAEAAELPPTPVPEQVQAKQTKASEEVGPDLGSLMQPEVLRQAANLAEAAQTVKATSWKTKLAWGVGGIIAFLVAWELFLGKLVMALVSIAILVLLVVAVLKLSGVIGGGEEGEEDQAPAEDELPA